jgi:hypothetical protein
MSTKHMKRVALHVPLGHREIEAIKRKAAELGMTQGEYARKLMYGKLEPMAAVKRADLRDGTVLTIKAPDMRAPMKLSNAKGKR